MAGLSSIAPRALSTERGQISYIESGSGPPLVLLHGIGSGARSWARQFGPLGERFRVVAWDAPGYGSSTPLPEPCPGAGDYAAALEQFLAAIGVGPCHLVGHSLGAIMAARFAAELHGRVLSLTLASIARGHAHLSEQERLGRLNSRLDDIRKVGAAGMAKKRAPNLLGSGARPEMLDDVIETMSLVRSDGYEAAAHMLSNSDILRDVARLPPHLPIQIIFGDEDTVTSPAANLEIASRCPGALVTRIAGAGHAVYIEAAERFNAAIVELASPTSA